MNPAEDPALVCLMTCPDAETATRIAHFLVEERLAACVNIVPAIRSIYRWEGAICDDAEVLCLIKTTAARHADLAARVTALHPYQVPELIAITIADGTSPYLDWLRAAVAAPV